MLNSEQNVVKAYEFGEEATLMCELISHEDLENINISFLVRDVTGVDLFGTTMFDENVELLVLKNGTKKSICFKFPVWLRQGSYSVSVAVNRVTNPDYSDVFLYEQVDGAGAFEVIRKIERPVHYKVHLPVRIIQEGDKHGK
jgi:lipopolysaccharide transport system ATP-binding protein